MPSEAVVWSILFLPVAAFLITSLIIRPFLNRYSLLSGVALAMYRSTESVDLAKATQLRN